MKFKEYVNNNNNKIEEMLFESVKLNSKIKKQIIGYFEHPRNGLIKMDIYPIDNQEVIVKWKNNKLTFILSMDFIEVINYIIDLCDDYGYKFIDNYNRNTVEIIIMVEED